MSEDTNTNANESAHATQAMGDGWQDGILSEYITPEALAAELNISTRTLDRWHAMREGPPRTKLGKRILYRRESFAEWLRSRETEAA